MVRIATVRQRSRGFLLLVVLVAALAVLPAAASAKGPAAELDKSFGKNGRAASTFAFAGSRPEYGTPASWENSNVDVIAGPGGSSLVAGKHQIIRLSADGMADSRFGAGGRLTPTTLAGLAFQMESVAIDGEGRLLVFGTGEDLGVTKRLGSSEGAGGVNVHPSYVVVARYTTSGVLDPSFGGGDGVATSDLDFHPTAPVVGGGPAPSLVGSVGGGVDGQDRPLAFTYGNQLGSSKYSGAVLNRTPLSLVRFSADGDFESGFGGSGRVALSQERDPRVIATPSGSLLIVGTIFSAEGIKGYTEVTELSSEGAVEAAFGENGSQVVVSSSDAALDSKGRLLLLQPPREKGRQQVLRLLANGEFDKSFGKGGRVGLRLPEKGDAASLAVDAKGRALIVGVGSRLLVGRLLASGARDRQFGKEGWLRTGMGKQTDLVGPDQTLEYPSRVPSAALSAGGKLLVADSGLSPKLPNGGVFLARYKLGS